MSTTEEGISSLWKNEDWWAVWIGFGILIFAVAMADLEYGVKAPKIQRWATSVSFPTDNGSFARSILKRTSTRR